MPVPGPYRLLSLEVSMITGDETEPSLEQRSVTGASGIKKKEIFGNYLLISCIENILIFAPKLLFMQSKKK